MRCLTGQAEEVAGEVKPADFTVKSAMTEVNGSYQFTFYCGLCDGGYTTQLICAANVKEAYERAQQEARQYFNRCHRCYRWVCDTHYNEDLMMCTDCAPRLARPDNK